MSNDVSDYESGFYRYPDSSMSSIAAAVISGAVSRSIEPGKVVLNGMTMTAEKGIETGLIDQAAADFIALQEGTNTPAPAVRTDA